MIGYTHGNDDGGGSDLRHRCNIHNTSIFYFILRLIFRTRRQTFPATSAMAFPLTAPD